MFALARGVELLGQDRGGGFKQPRYLVRRGDGQVAQLPHVLYLIASAIDGDRDAVAVAAEVGAALGRAVTAEQVGLLARDRLRPAGILAAPPDSVPTTGASASHAGNSGTASGASGARETGGQAPHRPDHLFALRYRKAVIPARAVWTVAGAFRMLYHPMAMLACLAAFVTVDGMILARTGIAQLRTGGQDLVHQPLLALLVAASVIAAGVFHECGHAAACRYSGATPGRMGVGLYLVWPAFYTNVTDAYRLGRSGRLRTDLGGVYFNTIALAVGGGVYLATGWTWLLATLVLLHVDSVWHFVPSIRLDGYYILADLVGVPDLFNRIGPILSSLLPGRSPSARVTELKSWVRRVVTAWVVLVVPFLCYMIASLVLIMFQLLPYAGDSLVRWLAGAQHALLSGHLATATLDLLQTLMLLLPLAGAAMVLLNLTRRLLRTALSPLSRGRLGPAIRTALSPRARYLALSGICAALLVRLGMVTGWNATALTAAGLIATSLVAVAILLRLPVAALLAITTWATLLAPRFTGLTAPATPSLLLAAGQAASLAGLAVATRSDRPLSVLRALPPFVIGAGVVGTPLVSLATALLAPAIAARGRRLADRRTRGRHRAAPPAHPMQTSKPYRHAVS